MKDNDESGKSGMKRREFLVVAASGAAATALGAAGCESLDGTARERRAAAASGPDWAAYFIELSAIATGVSQSDLQATGHASRYFNTARDIVGSEIFNELLQTGHDSGLDQILASPKHGPIARNIIKLWYVGTWEQLPEEWRQRYGSVPNDITFVVSSTSYVEGLLWPAIGTNPPGAKAPGYASWVKPPSIG